MTLSSVASAFLIFGAILTSLSATAGVIVAALGLLFEIGLFVYNGSR